MASGNSSSELVIKKSIVGVASKGDVNIGGNVNIYVSNHFEEFDLPAFVRTFQGRESDIETLDSLFFEQNQKKVVICGLPGYGKTELAKKYGSVCLNNKNIDNVFWIKSENTEDLQKAFPDLKKIYRSCKEQKCLFIYDNGICRQDTIDYEPPDIDNYFVLVTSQEKDWDDDFVPVKLEPLTPEAAVEVYKSILGDKYKEEDYNLYSDLANIIGNVPLGLQITAGYVRQNIRSLAHTFSLKEYIETVKRSQTDIFNKKIPRCIASSYKKSIYSAIKVSLDKIIEEEDEELRDLALNALYICSYLKPDFIWFFHLFGILNIHDDAISENKLMLALSLVDNLSFVNKIIGEKSFSYIKMHRLTQEILRFHLTSQEAEQKTNYYEMCVRYVFNDMTADFRSIHGNSIARHADENVLVIYQTYEKFYNDVNTLSINSTGLFRINQLFRVFLNLLVKFNCMKCLTKIFLSNTAHKYICEYELVYEAICFDQPDVLNFLLQYVDINSSIDENQNTFLHKAVQSTTKCIIKKIKKFIEYNANVNIKNVDGNVPLFELSKKCQFKKLDWIIYLDTLKFVKTNTNKRGETLLHMAVMGYNYDLTELLIVEYKMNVNVQDEWGRTPLHVIDCDFDRYRTHDAIIIVKQFLKYGVSLSIKDVSGTSVATGLLYIAVEVGDLDLLNLLLENNANVNCTDKLQATPLHVAAKLCNLKAMKILIPHAIVYAIDKDGNTPLDILLSDHSDKVELLEVNEVLDMMMQL